METRVLGRTKRVFVCQLLLLWYYIYIYLYMYIYRYGEKKGSKCVTLLRSHRASYYFSRHSYGRLRICPPDTVVPRAPVRQNCYTAAPFCALVRTRTHARTGTHIRTRPTNGKQRRILCTGYTRALAHVQVVGPKGLLSLWISILGSSHYVRVIFFGPIAAQGGGKQRSAFTDRGRVTNGLVAFSPRNHLYSGQLNRRNALFRYSSGRIIAHHDSRFWTVFLPASESNYYYNRVLVSAIEL